VCAGFKLSKGQEGGDDAEQNSTAARWKNVGATVYIFVGLSLLSMCFQLIQVGMDGWVVGWMVGWIDGWLHGWVDGWLHGWMGGWMHGWMLRFFYIYYVHAQKDFFFTMLCD
jgi:organic anion transporter 5A